MTEFRSVNSQLKHGFSSAATQGTLEKLVPEVLLGGSHCKRLALIDGRLLKVENNTLRGPAYCALHFGFPKPVYSVVLEPMVPGLGISYYILGGEVRGFQTDQIRRDVMEWSVPVAGPEEVPLATFRRISSRQARLRYQRLVYVNPFEDVGDSYLGLQSLSMVLGAVSADVTDAISPGNAMAGVPPFGTQDLAGILRTARDGVLLVIQPDIFDNHLSLTMATMRCIAEWDGDAVVWIPGRNIMMEHRSAARSRLHKLAGTEYYLWNQNFSDLLRHSIEVFVGKKSILAPNSSEIGASGSSMSEGGAATQCLLVNIHASHRVKDIPVAIAAQLIHRSRVPLAVLLSHDGKGDDSALVRMTQDRGNIRVLKARDLSALVDAISAADVTITTDSGPAHIANWLGKPSVVLYNEDRCDEESFLSTVYHSVVGYGSKQPGSLPVLFAGSLLGSSGAAVSESIACEEIADLTLRYCRLLLVGNWSPTQRAAARRFLRVAEDLSHSGSLLSPCDPTAVEFLSEIGAGADCADLMHRYYFVHFSDVRVAMLSRSIEGAADLVLRLSPPYKLARRVLTKLE